MNQVKLNGVDYSIIFHSPVNPGNACHCLMPSPHGIWLHDLDAGEIYVWGTEDVVEAQAEPVRPVEMPDFEFSWVLDWMDEDDETGDRAEYVEELKEKLGLT